MSLCRCSLEDASSSALYAINGEAVAENLIGRSNSRVNGIEDSQNQPPYGDRYVRTTGYMEWAEANDLILLFPQAEGGDSNDVQNPEGCWDWWGYSAADPYAPDYYSRDALQIRAIHTMLARLGGV